MTVLKGTGPATASAVLSAYDASIPFLSDEAMLAALGSKEYTVKAVQQLTVALRSKAQQLSTGGGRQWSSRDVERCLWGAALGGGAGAGGSKKAGPAEPLEWHFSQVFGERSPGEEVQEADIISAVEFDYSGDFLATGDQGGRVVLFERIAAARSRAGHPDVRPDSPLHTNPYEFRYLTEFQSHEPEFDYLKSLEIEEKINKVRWVRGRCGGKTHMLLTTNDKTVKLWKVYEKKVASLAEFNLQNGSSLLNAGGRPGSAGSGPFSPDKLRAAANAAAAAPNSLRIPRVVGSETLLATRCKRAYANAHTYHINSIALSSDCETFISADDLRVNLWHLDRQDQAFNIVDIKPQNMEDLTEVITCADFHPQHCHLFAYSSSKGLIRLADMRQAALCDQHAKLFEDAEPAGPRSFFSEIISSINDIRFSPCGRYILSRDYMTLKLWDLNMDAGPVQTYSVHESLRGKLCDLYESDCIFDKFDAAMSGDGRYFATGTYSNFFRVTGTDGSSDNLLEASRDPTRKRLASSGKLPSRFGLSRGGSGRGSRSGSFSVGEEALAADFSSKLLHLSWHPHANVIATAASNSLYLFYGSGGR
ncbi:Serine threonine phosphatase 2A 55 kDa regulatory subunit B beta isoform isoform B [Micractinium conductrix]|uniref:Serine/threonine-protein phosphatase 2A 55 kDa regulatory subunit B n=1 Tax=Micractinium conductrix TaxID=554055 RepID=A0A2P6VQ06_9CHLO|nr:Serine threonine phosphatase 2A 55 kDa regulatory subunit B beta isoform isoform B [Micractinium conductrix]|eukprot:PSC76183.1 Serine threonine phosphatase 2A 55 kDa regulatory subunit B beta isoform isoform B [Micractinium conductrix]